MRKLLQALLLVVSFLVVVPYRKGLQTNFISRKDDSDDSKDEVELPELDRGCYWWEFRSPTAPERRHFELVTPQKGFYNIGLNGPMRFCRGGHSGFTITLGDSLDAVDTERTHIDTEPSVRKATRGRKGKGKGKALNTKGWIPYLESVPPSDQVNKVARSTNRRSERHPADISSDSAGNDFDYATPEEVLASMITAVREHHFGAYSHLLVNVDHTCQQLRTWLHADAYQVLYSCDYSRER
jgi:hypothetical protein